MAILNYNDLNLTLHSTTFWGLLLEIREKEPELLLIDAPLSLPEEGSWRPCEKKLLKLGFQPLPLTFSSMRKLSKEGMELKKRVKNFVPHIFETFPAASLQELGFETKPNNKNARRKATLKISNSYEIKINEKIPSQDEFDAFICCLAGLSWIRKSHHDIMGENCRIILVGNSKGKIST